MHVVEEQGVLDAQLIDLIPHRFHDMHVLCRHAHQIIVHVCSIVYICVVVRGFVVMAQSSSSRLMFRCRRLTRVNASGFVVLKLIGVARSRWIYLHHLVPIVREIVRCKGRVECDRGFLISHGVLAVRSEGVRGLRLRAHARREARGRLPTAKTKVTLVRDAVLLRELLLLKLPRRLLRQGRRGVECLVDRGHEASQIVRQALRTQILRGIARLENAVVVIHSASVATGSLLCNGPFFFTVNGLGYSSQVSTSQQKMIELALGSVSNASRPVRDTNSTNNNTSTGRSTYSTVCLCSQVHHVDEPPGNPPKR